MNELHTELVRHSDWAKIEHCLGEIYARVVAHFALEERYMRDTNYEQHKREHDQFLEVIVDIIEAFRANSEIEHGAALEAQLQRWIINHITTSDQELASPEESNLGLGEKIKAYRG